VKIHSDPESLNVTNPVVTLGIFDGVHTGHQSIIARLNSLAKESGGESVLITFWPHPRLMLNREPEGLKYLTTLDEKKILLEETGIDHLVILPFTRELSNMEACEFMEKLLVERFHTRQLVIGFDQRFGKNREGNFEVIKKCGKKFGIRSFRVPALDIEGEKVSSTLIRQALWGGRIRDANNLLGYPFFINGTIVGGRSIGRKIGFPTANIITRDKHKLVPSDGVYAVKLKLNGEILDGMLNIGIRPTLAAEKKYKTIEVHIFDFSRDIYGQDVTLIFVDRLRDEKKFPDVTGLVRQMKQDKQNALRILNKI